MGKKQLSGAMKRKKKKEKEDAAAEAAADLERLKLGPSKLWTGLVTHHRDIFVSHVLPKLNRADRFCFSMANTESFYLLKYAGVDVLDQGLVISECSSISTLDYAWNNAKWEGTSEDGHVIDQAWFCSEVALTNKLELLKWVREEKKCEWNERTIVAASYRGNLEMLKYCFANDCPHPHDEPELLRIAATCGTRDCLRFLFDEIKPSQVTELTVATIAAEEGQLDILKYLIEERSISDGIKQSCVGYSIIGGYVDCLKYMVEEAKVPLNNWHFNAAARYFKRTECLHYLREKRCPEPTDEEYASCVEEFLNH